MLGDARDGRARRGHVARRAARPDGRRSLRDRRHRSRSRNRWARRANTYAHVEAAIALAQESGLHYEVNALGTTIEGPPDEVWPLLRRMHESCLTSGARARHHRVQDRTARRRPARRRRWTTSPGSSARERGRPPARGRRAAGRVLRARARRLGDLRAGARCRRLRAARRRARCGARSSTWRPTSVPTSARPSPRRRSAWSSPRSPASRSRS